VRRKPHPSFFAESAGRRAARIARWEQRSAELRAAMPEHLDLRYGPADRGAPTLIFIDMPPLSSLPSAAMNCRSSAASRKLNPAAWQARRLPGKLQVLPGRHHYSAIEEPTWPQRVLTQALVRVVFQSEKK
jgi:hypothetical protein